MKIATFNINNINKRLANVVGWLEREKPEVACLQELKSEQDCFPADALRSAGYEAVVGGGTLLEWCGPFWHVNKSRS